MSNDWAYIKKHILYLDGGLRDIVINDMTSEKWKIFFNFIDKYTATYKYSGIVISKNEFIQKLFTFWEEGLLGYDLLLTISIDNISINYFFNSSDTIEQDFDPREINSLEDFLELERYLKGLANELNKIVYVTEEMNKNGILLIVHPK